MAAPVIQRLTPKKKTAFLLALAETGNVVQAAKRVRCSRERLYRERRTDEGFAQGWDESLSMAMDTVLEPEAVRRGVQGVLKPIYYKGMRVGTVREYSDTLLMFLLKGGKPERYKDRLDVQHKGVITLVQKLAKVPTMTDDELQTFIGEVQAYVNEHTPA